MVKSVCGGGGGGGGEGRGRRRVEGVQGCWRMVEGVWEAGKRVVKGWVGRRGRGRE